MSTYIAIEAICAFSSENTYHKLHSETLAKQSIINQNEIPFALYHRAPPEVLLHQLHLAPCEDFITNYVYAPRYSQLLNVRIGLGALPAVEQSIEERLLSDEYWQAFLVNGTQSAIGCP